MSTLKECLEYMFSNGYLLITIGGEVTITNKLKRELVKIPLKTNDFSLEGKTATQIATKGEVWEKFMNDAEVPHKVIATDGKSYTVKQWSAQIQQKLISIIQKVKDYTILTESTKLYYKSNTYKLTFKNYLEREVWKNEYEKYEQALKNPQQLDNLLSTGSGKNKFED